MNWNLVIDSVVIMVFGAQMAALGALGYFGFRMAMSVLGTGKGTFERYRKRVFQIRDAAISAYKKNAEDVMATVVEVRDLGSSLRLSTDAGSQLPITWATFAQTAGLVNTVRGLHGRFFGKKTPVKKSAVAQRGAAPAAKKAALLPSFEKVGGIVTALRFAAAVRTAWTNRVVRSR